MYSPFPVSTQTYLFEFEHLIGVGEKGKVSGELWYPTGVAVDEDADQIYITEGYYDTARVSVFSMAGEFIKSFARRDMGRPWDIKLFRDNLYITDAEKHLVYRFKLVEENRSIRLVKTVGGKGFDFDEFRDPRQFAVSPTGDLYISDRSNHRIKILDKRLSFQREISHKSMRHPRSVQLTPDRVYVLSETDSPCVHTFSHSGDKLRSIIRSGPGKPLTQPYFMFIDANDRLFISDWNTHQIKIFSKKGRLLRSLGGRGDGAGKFNYPSGLVFTNDLKLIIVSLNKNFGLQIFSIQ